MTDGIITVELGAFSEVYINHRAGVGSWARRKTGSPMRQTFAAADFVVGCQTDTSNHGSVGFQDSAESRSVVLDDPFELAALFAQDELEVFCTSSAFGELMDSAVADAMDDLPSTTSVDGPSGPAYPCRYSAQYDDFTVNVQIGFSFGNAPAVVRSNTLAAFARLGATVITDEPGEDRWLVTFDSPDRLLGDQTQVGVKVQSASLLIGVEVLPNGDGYIASEAVARRVKAVLPEFAARPWPIHPEPRPGPTNATQPSSTPTWVPRLPSRTASAPTAGPS